MSGSALRTTSMPGESKQELAKQLLGEQRVIKRSRHDDTNLTMRDNDIVEKMVTVPDLSNWSRALIIEVVLYAHIYQPYLYFDPIYLFGGFGYSESAGMFDDEELPSMISGHKRNQCCASRIGDNIYVSGGYNESGSLSTVERFNIPTRTWSILPSLLEARSDHISIAVDDRLYVLGGFNRGYDYVKSMEVFDTKRNVWLPRTTDPPIRSRSTHCSVQIMGRIIIFGANDVKSVSSFNTVNNIWTALTPMNHMRYGGCAVSIDDGDNSGLVIVLGGSDGVEITKVVEEYNAVTDTWRTLDWTLPYDFDRWATLAAWYDRYNKTLHVAFGLLNVSPHYVRRLDDTSNNKYDGNGWTKMPSYPYNPCTFAYCA
jgi:hypothetical protein